MREQEIKKGNSSRLYASLPRTPDHWRRTELERKIARLPALCVPPQDTGQLGEHEAESRKRHEKNSM
jgi:hypothetical protein